MLTFCPRHVFLLTTLLICVLLSCDNTQSDENQTDLLVEKISHSERQFSVFANDTLSLLSEWDKSIKENDTIRQLALLNLLGDTHFGHYRFERAAEYRRKMVQLAEQTNNPKVMTLAYNDLAESCRSLSLMDEAVRFYYSALRDVEEGKDGERQENTLFLRERAKSLSGIGTIYSTMQNNDAAKYFLDKALACARQIGDRELIPQMLLWKGETFLNMQQYDSAKIYFSESLELYIKENSRSGLGQVFHGMGKLEMRQNNNTEAVIHLDNAYNTLESTADLLNQMHVDVSLGDVHADLGNLAAAERYYKEGVSIAENLTLYYHLENIHNKLSLLYQTRKNEKLAAHHLLKSHQFGSKLDNRRIQPNLLDVQMEYQKEIEAERVSKMKLVYDARSRTQNIIILAGLIIITLLVSSFAVYSRYMVSRRQNNRTLIQTARMKSEFYKQLSDEFRTPLAIIGGLAEKLKEGVRSGDPMRNMIDLDIIEKQSRNLVSLVDEMLTVSKMNAGDGKNLQYGNIAHYLEFLHSGFIELANLKEVEFTFHASVKEIHTDFSKESIRLMINNLIHFGLRRSAKGDKLIMLVRENRSEKRYVIEISGKGDSLSSKETTQMFDIFYQREIDADNRGVVNGNIVFARQMVKGMGGEFNIRRDDPKTTSFIIELPIKSNLRKHKHVFQEDFSIPGPELSLKAEIETNMHQDEDYKPTVLIVEDNAYMIFYINSILKEDYNVLRAEDGREALIIAKEKTPELIITDWMLPQIDGKDLTILLKRSETTSHIPIIMITANTSVEDRIDAIKSGVDAVLPKPFNDDELTATIQNLLRSRIHLRKKFSRISIDNPENDEEQVSNEVLDFIQKIIDIIYREMQNADFFPDGLANEMNVSTAHLNRKIKSISGLNTMAYVNTVKLSRAKKLLVSTQRPVGDIAMECGFADFSYFSRLFKKEFGITPSRFQKMPVKDEMGSKN